MIAQHSNWLSIVLTTVVAASALLSVQGCGSDDPTNDLPSLRELGPRVPERSENDLPVENEDRLVLQGEQLYLPLYVPLADAWSQVDEQAVPALTRQLWQANGMRIGLLRSGQYRELVKRLPEQMHRTNSIIRTSQVPGTLVISPAINQPHTVDLTVPPRPVREQRVADGRLQLLVEATGTGLGSVPLRIMPHHYKPRVSLRPVDPMRRHLEGASFGELAINVALAPGEALVVGLKREWAETDQEVGNESDASPEQVA
ncbi:MAG: hypothetical protein MI741_11490, partial [Rhodospirillales bacterium]|nr:hypothetical protein [Rhodospirillales bacterium]